MKIIQRDLKPRPYAANSTGRARGLLSLGIGFGRVRLYDAIGPAREIFTNQIGPDIVAHLNNTTVKLPGSAEFVDLSLFMVGKVGKSPERTKPMVIFVSNDKQARKAAIRTIKQGGIIEKYPGFCLGEMPLKAEFEDLRPLGSQLEPIVTSKPGSAFSTLGPWMEIFAGDTESPHIWRLEMASQHEHTANGSSGTAGGMVCYKGSYFLHGSEHILRPPQSGRNSMGQSQPLGSDGDEDECELWGWSDDDEEDNDEMVDITSCGSASPLVDDRQSTCESSSESQGKGDLVFSYDTFEDRDDAHVSALRPPVSTPVACEHPSPLPPPEGRTGTPLGVGKVVLRSTLLDSVLVRVSPSQSHGFPELQSAAITLESYREHVELAPADAAVRATTLRGTIGGTLSGTPSFVQVPGSEVFQEVYVGMLNQPLVPGDCGSWVKNAVTGKLFGHVIAGSPTTGLVFLMPAIKVFAEALAALEVREAEPQELSLAENDLSVRNRDEWDNPAKVPKGCDPSVTNPVGALFKGSITHTTSFERQCEYDNGIPRPGSPDPFPGRYPPPLAEEIRPILMSLNGPRATRPVHIVHREPTLKSSLGTEVQEHPSNPQQTEQETCFESQKHTGKRGQANNLEEGMDQYRYSSALASRQGNTADLKLLNSNVEYEHHINFRQRWVHSTPDSIPTSPESNLSTSVADDRGPIHTGNDDLKPLSRNSRLLSCQFIPSNLDPERETFLDVQFLAKTERDSFATFIEFRNIFVSPSYSASYIFADTLKVLGHEPIVENIKVSCNPRGGVFRPIGVATVYVKFTGVEHPYSIRFVPLPLLAKDLANKRNSTLVLGGSSIDSGVSFILGKPDIHRILGADWAPPSPDPVHGNSEHVTPLPAGSVSVSMGSGAPPQHGGIAPLLNPGIVHSKQQRWSALE